MLARSTAGGAAFCAKEKLQREISRRNSGARMSDIAWVSAIRWLRTSGTVLAKMPRERAPVGKVSPGTLVTAEPDVGEEDS